MKYIILLGDGMSGYPLDELGGKTTLQAANTPNMDRIAREGTAGLARNVPEGFPAGSDVANLSVLGYDPAKYYTGRAPLEAASMGVELDEKDVAYRCNLVNLDMPEGKLGPDCTMVDFSAGHIKSDESRPIMIDLGEKMTCCKSVSFYPGVSYRHLMVWKEGKDAPDCTPPHDITGRKLDGYLPKGDGADYLIELMEKSVGILAENSINKKRKVPASSIWLWGQGKRPSMPPYAEHMGLRGAMISAVDLMKGIAVMTGLEVIDVPGATGFIDTNYVGKAEHALDALTRHDFVYVHVESPDESGHMGNAEYKIKAMEDFDRLVVGTVLDGLGKLGDVRILLMPDHPTPIAVKTHTHDPVPFVMWGPGIGTNGAKSYDEKETKNTGLMVEHGHELMRYMIKGGIGS